MYKLLRIVLGENGNIYNVWICNEQDEVIRVKVFETLEEAQSYMKDEYIFI